MIRGSKRRRSDDGDAVAEGVSETVQKMVQGFDDIVGSVGKVNGAVLESMLRKIHEAEGTLDAFRNSGVQLWQLIVGCQQGRAATALNHVAAAAEVARKDELITALQQQLLNSTAAAAEEVSNGMDTSNSAVVALFSSQLKGEQELNEQLVLRVREFLRHSLEVIQTYSSRALKAELSISKKELTVARLQSSLAFYQNASLRHHDEILLLIKIVRLLVEKNKDVDFANSKLRQAKAHVRLLEKQLDLAGIVHAVVPPDFVPLRAPTDAPNDALRRTAPEYFALRLLEHKDITLSELVDSWQQQEARIVAAEEKYRKLEVSVEALRQEALTVHQSFLEEKRRREVVEHRLVDLVRERIHTSSNDALVRQLTQLRADYTKVLDDLAQVTTALGVTRETLAREQQRGAMLETKLQQMKDDSELDEVANTLSSLRGYYEEEIERLRREMVDADTQNAVAVARAELLQKATVEADNALVETERTAMDLSSALQRAEERLLAAQQQSRSVHLERVMEDAQKALALSETHLQKATASFQMMMLKAETQQKKDMTYFGQQVAQLLESLQSLFPLVCRTSQGAVDAEATAMQEREVRLKMRDVLAHALHFVSENLVTSEIEKSNLLDISMDNSQNVTLLLEKVQTLTAERDAALERSKLYEQLIEQHSLTAIEGVLMHEVSVDESLDAIEASEQIATLRKTVSSLEAVSSAAVAEVKRVREELRQSECEAESRATRLGLLERHNSRLSASLEECLAREVILVEQVHQLQRCPSAPGDCGAAVVSSSHDSTGVETTEGRAQMMQQIEHLCGGISEIKEQLAQMRAGVAAAKTAENEEVETQLLRHGVRQVADSLREVMRRAELFRHAFPEEETTRVAVAATSVATSTEVTQEGQTTTEEASLLGQHCTTTADQRALEKSVRDEELTRLRKELEAYTETEETLKNNLRDSQLQNVDLQQKVQTLLQINKKLLERLKTTQPTAPTTTTVSGMSPAAEGTSS